MNLPKTKACRICKLSYMPRSSLQVVCSPPCAIAHAEKTRQKREKCEQKAVRKVDREKKQKLKTWQQWFNEAKEVAQKYARIRDYRLGCVSCSKPPNWHGQWHGSHFRPAGNFKAVALNLWNIHKACSECNNWKSGNLVEMTDTLVVKIGQEKVDWLKSQTQPYRHSIEYLARYKKVIGKRCRMMEKRLILNS
jgi:hypothetical protein